LLPAVDKVRKQIQHAERERAIKKSHTSD
jgi:hypothetical protein